MHQNVAEQVTVTSNQNLSSMRKTTRMARKGRLPVCENITQKKISCPTPKTAVTKQGRCMRPGPLQRNPYLNFLREYRKQNCGLSAVETVLRGAKAWKCLTAEEKAQYIVQAFYTRNRKTRLRDLYCMGRRRIGKSTSPRRSRRVRRRARRKYRVNQ